MPIPAPNTLASEEQKLQISSDDLRRLVSHPDRDVRAVLAQKVCRQIKTAKLTEAEQAVVQKILNFVVRDAASMVRRALAVTLKNSPNLPRNIARELIKDVDSVAVPILECSPVLTDDDLIEILKSKAAAKLLAISRRPKLHSHLVRAIIRYGDSKAVASVAANDGAEIGADLGAEMLTIYHDDDLVKESFIARHDLPPLVVEKLITMISSEAAIRLNERHEVPIDVAIDIANRSRERAQIDFVSQSWVSRDLAALTARLYQEDRLTNSLIVRALCCGQMRFVEHALSVRASLSLSKAVLMIHDSGPIGVRALCARAGFSQTQCAILRAGAVIYRDLELKGAHLGNDRFQKIMLERVLSLPITFEDDDIDYLLEKLDRFDALAA